LVRIRPAGGYSMSMYIQHITAWVWLIAVLIGVTTTLVAAILDRRRGHHR